MKLVFLFVTCLAFDLVAVRYCEELHNLAYYQLVEVQDEPQEDISTKREPGKKSIVGT